MSNEFLKVSMADVIRLASSVIVKRDGDNEGGEITHRATGAYRATDGSDRVVFEMTQVEELRDTEKGPDKNPAE